MSKSEYEALEFVAKREGLTVDQAAQLAVCEYLLKWKPSLLAELRKRVDAKVLEVLEKQ